MKLHLKALLVVLVLGAIAAGLFYRFVIQTTHDDSAPVKSVEVMEKEGVPDFEGKLLDGGSVKLSSYKGKLTIVNFWASWCSPCVEEVPSLIKLVKEFKGDIQLIAVSEDSTKDDINIFLKSFPDLKADNIHIVWDSDHALMNQFDASRLPESMVVAKDGKLLKKIIGSINWYTSDSLTYVKTALAK